MYHLNLTGRRYYDQLYAGCIRWPAAVAGEPAPSAYSFCNPDTLTPRPPLTGGGHGGKNYQRMKWDFVTSFIFTNHLISQTSDNPFTPYFNLSSINNDKNSGILWFKFRKYSKSPEITCLTNLSNLSLRSSKFCMQVTALVCWLCSSVAWVTRALSSSSNNYLETQSPIVLCPSDTLPNNLSMQAKSYILLFFSMFTTPLPPSRQWFSCVLI